MKLETQKSKNSIFLGAVTIIFLLGLYLFSEQIKFITVATTILLIAYYSFYQTRISRKFGKKTILYLVYIIVSSAYTLVFTSVDSMDVLEFIISMIVALMFCIVQSSAPNVEKSIKAVQIVAYVSLLGCILQFVSPATLSSFSQLRMGSLKYGYYYDFLRSGYVVGFSFQTAVTAFYLTILILLIGCKWISSKNRLTVVNCIILAVSFVLLFMTAKRIFIALTALIVLFIFSLYNKKHIFKIILIASILIVALYFLFNNTIVGERLLYRMNSVDPTRGRASIYASMFDYFKEAPIMGKGLSFMLHGVSGYQNGHNIYLQILVESGVIGFGLLVSWMLANIVSAIRMLLTRIRMGKESYYLTFSVSIQLLFIGWGFTGNPLYDVYPLIVYMICVGITYYEIGRNEEVIYG